MNPESERIASVLWDLASPRLLLLMLGIGVAAGLLLELRLRIAHRDWWRERRRNLDPSSRERLTGNLETARVSRKDVLSLQDPIATGLYATRMVINAVTAIIFLSVILIHRSWLSRTAVARGSSLVWRGLVLLLLSELLLILVERVLWFARFSAQRRSLDGISLWPRGSLLLWLLMPSREAGLFEREPGNPGSRSQPFWRIDRAIARATWLTAAALFVWALWLAE